MDAGAHYEPGDVTIGDGGDRGKRGRRGNR